MTLTMITSDMSTTTTSEWCYDYSNNDYDDDDSYDDHDNCLYSIDLEGVTVASNTDNTATNINRINE